MLLDTVGKRTDARSRLTDLDFPYHEGVYVRLLAKALRIRFTRILVGLTCDILLDSSRIFVRYLWTFLDPTGRVVSLPAGRSFLVNVAFSGRALSFNTRR